MIRQAWNAATRNAVHKAINSQVARRGWLQPKLGYSLFRDSRVPLSRKLLAIGIGAGLTALLVAAELPLESILAFVMPALGLALDMLSDGAETLICPILIATILLPHLTPRSVMTEIQVGCEPSDSERVQQNGMQIDRAAPCADSTRLDRTIYEA